MQSEVDPAETLQGPLSAEYPAREQSHPSNVNSIKIVVVTVMLSDTTSNAKQHDPEMLRLTTLSVKYLSVAKVILFLLILPGAAFAATNDQQMSFDTPDQAVQTLVKAVRADQPRQILKLLGPEGERLVFSGDPVADKIGREKFISAYDKANRIERQNAEQYVLIIGKKQWPFPIPIIKTGSSWSFDTQAGVEEILDRRIGRNELSAIEVCLAYVDAQREYASEDRDNDGILEYAQHFLSSQGKHDGLYWPATNKAQSPMGPLIAAARAEGYSPGKDPQQALDRAPYHGYFYRIIKRQGSYAADGARDYLAEGSMIGGFALVAFPARYGDSGVMTFIVSQDGIVYQKNLGADTETIARQMTEYDPDSSWAKASMSNTENENN